MACGICACAKSTLSARFSKVYSSGMSAEPPSNLPPQPSDEPRPDLPVEADEVIETGEVVETDEVVEQMAEVADEVVDSADPSSAESESTAPPTEDVSLEQLSDAFQQMLDPDVAASDEASAGVSDVDADLDLEPGESVALPEAATDEDDACPITPHSILEAMLFVGDASNEPLGADRVAQLVRGVEADEVAQLVDELNAEYESTGRAYEIRSESGGFRLALREEFSRVTDRFYGRVREAKLSQAAIEVLALVAYNQPMTSHRVNELRGHPSGAILSQLVRRELLQMKRPEEKPRTPVYHTTPRFLQLFGLTELEELPQAEELER